MRNLNLEKKICGAIKQHLIIRFRYNDQSYYRTFEPYLIYHSPKDENEILIGGTQTKDDSQPMKKASPHKFNIAHISSLEVTGDFFEYDNRFDPTRDEYKNGILCVIKRDKIEQ